MFPPLAEQQATRPIFVTDGCRGDRYTPPLRSISRFRKMRTKLACEDRDRERHTHSRACNAIDFIYALFYKGREKGPGTAPWEGPTSLPWENPRLMGAV